MMDDVNGSTRHFDGGICTNEFYTKVAATEKSRCDDRSQKRN